ncbi:MAG: two-component system, chemotaxis family, sensor kinase CheA [Pseudonocardiales bacterium]|nr:two-component system, chemotaxis family, sensor kinase CheA [Pseudonocardiales bacterium]
MTSVLVVDDSELTHALVRRALESAGFRTVHALSAEEALALLPGTPVDVMVVDIVLPGIDGIQFAEAVRTRSDVDSQLPVVFYSAHANGEALRRRVAAVQPATLVAKDGNIQDLIEAVTNVIDAHAAVRTAKPPVAVILHVGKGLVATSLQRDGRELYELRRGPVVLLEAPTLEELLVRADEAGLT